MKSNHRGSYHYPLLVIGAGGFVGGALVDHLAKDGKIAATYHTGQVNKELPATFVHLDITDRDACNDLIARLRPGCIILVAALANMAQCYQNQSLAWNINVMGAGHVAMAASQMNARLIYISTDLVFSGENAPYIEEDSACPVCYYGKSKLEAENRISTLLQDFVVIRSSLLYGWSKNNSQCFTEHIISELQKGNEVKLYTDEFRTPLFINDFCNIMQEIVENPGFKGLFHLGGPERMSRYEFGLETAAVFNLEKGLILPVKQSDCASDTDKRPHDCSLASKKLLSQTTNKTHSIRESLLNMKSELKLPLNER